MSRLRITEKQWLLFQQAKGKPAGTPSLRPKQRREDLPENQITGQIKDFLQVRGWCLQRNHVGTFVPYHQFIADKKDGNPRIIKLGEKGMADWHATRALPGKPWLVEYFDFEVKAPGQKPQPHQVDWMQRRKLVGFEAHWFDGVHEGASPLDQWYAERFTR